MATLIKVQWNLKCSSLAELATVQMLNSQHVAFGFHMGQSGKLAHHHRKSCGAVLLHSALSGQCEDSEEWQGMNKTHCSGPWRSQWDPPMNFTFQNWWKSCLTRKQLSSQPNTMLGFLPEFYQPDVGVCLSEGTRGSDWPLQMTLINNDGKTS